MKKRFWRDSMLVLPMIVIALCSQASAASNATLTISNTGTPISSPGTITVAFGDSAGHAYSETAPYGLYSTPASLAAWFGAAFTRSYVCPSVGNCTGGLGAHANGSVITFQLNNGASFGFPAITNPSVSFSFSTTAWQAVPVISWATPAAITYGTALSAAQLNATGWTPTPSGALTVLPGTFAYSPASGTVPTAGLQTLSATFTPTDTTDYSTANSFVSVVVNKASATLTVVSSGTPSTYGNPVTFTANISSGLTGTVTFYDSGMQIGSGAISGTTATLTTSSLAAGSHSITAGWSGNTNYNETTSSAIAQIVTLQQSAGTINTMAGTGTAGYNGDGGPAINAEISGLYLGMGVALDLSNNLYIADYGNNRIREVNASTGDISTVAGNGNRGQAGDGGPATSAEVIPAGVALDSVGNIYIADYFYSRIRKVTASTGIISTLAGNGSYGYTGDGGSAANSQLFYPTSVAVDAVGNIYIADEGNSVIRKITASTGIISTLVGSGEFPNGYGQWVCNDSGDGGPATSATVCDPWGVAVDSQGNLYIADSAGHRIRLVSAATGIITTVAGSGSGCAQQIDSIGDGCLATQSELSDPVAAVVDLSGDIYIADGNVVRMVTATTGIITTVAGAGSGCSQQTDSLGDGCPATGSELSGPTGLAVDPAFNFYIADSGNHRIREVVPSQAKPTITWTAPTPISYGTALSTIQLNATASNGYGTIVPGTFAYHPALGTTLGMGLQTLTVIFAPNDTTNYARVIASVQLLVTPEVNWPSPAPIQYGAPLSTTQLNATANVSGTFVYKPPAGTVLSIGSQTITLTFTPANSNYATVSETAQITVGPDTPVITSILANPAAVGTTVTIVGQNFGPSQGSSTVTFNGVAATTLSSWTDSSFKATVPPGATTGDVIVTVGGVASNSFLFMVPVSCVP
ncbi:MAG: Ig-like domain repeat protein [Terracidiphilus sp.]|jgi:sugar lactone lactonase YvrE